MGYQATLDSNPDQRIETELLNLVKRLRISEFSIGPESSSVAGLSRLDANIAKDMLIVATLVASERLHAYRLKKVRGKRVKYSLRIEAVSGKRTRIYVM